MEPFNILVFLIAACALVLGFIVGRIVAGRRERRKTPRFSDPKTAREANEKSQEAVEERTEERKQKVMALATKEGKITNDDVEDLLCVSDSTARNYLNELEEEGRLTQVGDTGRGVHYTPNVKGSP